MSSAVGLLRLAVRRWRSSWKAQVSAIILTGLVMAAFLLYFGYINTVTGQFLGRVQKPAIPGDFGVEYPPGRRMPVNLLFHGIEVLDWTITEVESAYGQVPLAAVSLARPESGIPEPEPGEVYLPEEFALDWGLTPGSRFAFRLPFGAANYRTVEGVVAGSYSASYAAPVLVAKEWVNGIAPLRGQEQIFYQAHRDPAAFINYLSRQVHQARIITPESVLGDARSLMMSAFGSSVPALVLIWLFLVLGVGTVGLLTFIDSKRELSVLKSLGLKPSETGALFVIESAFNAVVGLAVGVLLARALTARLPAADFLMSEYIAHALALALLAYVGASLPAYLLARAATVNQLMLDQPIRVFRREIRGLPRRYPALEPRLAQGLAVLKLDTADGLFKGIIFRKPGDKIKQGETLAWTDYAFGLGERLYIAPCDGDIIECCPESGIISIEPAITE